MVSILNCLNIIKCDILKQKKISFLKKTNLTETILEKLIFLKLIDSYKKKLNKQIIVVHKHNQEQTVLKNIKLLYKTTNKYVLSTKQLKLLSASTSKSIYFLSTPKGILTHIEALELKTSGFLIFKILL